MRKKLSYIAAAILIVPVLCGLLLLTVLKLTGNLESL